jgi:S1-C subfamily serine protease
MPYQLSILLGLCVCATIFRPPVVLADPAASNVAQALVRIHVFGQVQNGTEEGESVDNWGSGVVLAKDRIVTAYHVIYENEYGNKVTWMTGSPKKPED